MVRRMQGRFPAFPGKGDREEEAAKGGPSVLRARGLVPLSGSDCQHPQDPADHLCSLIPYPHSSRHSLCHSPDPPFSQNGTLSR